MNGVLLVVVVLFLLAPHFGHIACSAAGAQVYYTGRVVFSTEDKATLFDWSNIEITAK